jgi:hypothetical protein
MKHTKHFLSLVLAALMVLSMSIPALAAEGASVTISSDYDGDGTTDFSWTLPGVVKTETMQMADDPTKGSYPTEQNVTTFKALAGKEVTVYTISLDTKISIEGAQIRYFDQMLVNSGKLYRKEFESLDAVRKQEIPSEVKTAIPNGNGHTWTSPGTGSYIQFLKTGYYAFTQHPYHPTIRDVNLSTGAWGDKHYENYYKYSTVILHVVSASEATTLAASAPITSTDPAASTVSIENVQERFDKWYSNDLVAVNATQGQNTVKTTVKSPVFYSYDTTANSIKTLTVEHTVSNGSITFTAPSGGVIIISEGKLTK